MCLKPMEAPVNEIITRIVREGDRHVVEIPKEFGPANAEVTIRKDGDTLVIKAKVEKGLTLREALDALEPLTEEEWPDITDDDRGPLRDVKL
jgi:virulence-associated protein VagC